jgi:hypothetical protein
MAIGERVRRCSSANNVSGCEHHEFRKDTDRICGQKQKKSDLDGRSACFRKIVLEENYF